jgi:hypothetical protein
MAATPKAARRGSRPCSCAYDRVRHRRVHAQFDRLIEAVAEKVPTVAEYLETARADGPPGLHQFPKEVRRQSRFNNSQERLNRESRCCTVVLGIFPDSTAIIRPRRSRHGRASRRVGPKTAALRPGRHDPRTHQHLRWRHHLDPEVVTLNGLARAAPDTKDHATTTEHHAQD